MVKLDIRYIPILEVGYFDYGQNVHKKVGYFYFTSFLSIKEVGFNHYGWNCMFFDIDKRMGMLLVNNINSLRKSKLSSFKRK